MKCLLTTNLEKSQPRFFLEQISYLGAVISAKYSCGKLSFFFPVDHIEVLFFSYISFLQGGWEVSIWERRPVISSGETCCQAAMESCATGAQPLSPRCQFSCLCYALCRGGLAHSFISSCSRRLLSLFSKLGDSLDRTSLIPLSWEISLNTQRKLLSNAIIFRMLFELMRI